MSQDLLEISIQESAGSPTVRERHSSVDITSRPFDLVELVNRFDSAAGKQSIPLNTLAQLQLGRLLEIGPIRFLDDGRWQLRLLTSSAELGHFA